MCSTVLVAVIATVALCAPTGASASAARSRPAPRAATTWDPRIESVAHAVERLRGLEFERPVPVVILDDGDFRERLTPPTARLSDTRRAQLDQSRALWSALGLVDRDADFANGLRALAGADVAAVYDPRTGRVYVNGDFRPLVRRVLLAHELTHALDDQHFDLQAVLTDGVDDDGSQAVRALIEGDAERVRNRYLAELSSADRARYRELLRPRAERARAELRAEKVPPGLQALFAAPYSVGASMVETITAASGTSVDQLFRHPPTREIAEVNPTAMLDGSRFPRVDAPAPDGGDRSASDPMPFGALSLYLVLAEHIPLVDALAAADGWRAGSMVSFRRSATPCVRVRVAGRTVESTARISTALSRWSAQMPPRNVEIVGGTDHVDLIACDRPFDPASVPARVAPLRALAFIGDRNLLIADQMSKGASPAIALCAADRVVANPAIASTVDAQARQTLLDENTDAVVSLRNAADAGRARCSASAGSA